VSGKLEARYLRLLGFQRRPSGLRGLREIVRRHLMRVPFENVSKLLLFGREGAGRPLELDEFLDGIGRYDLGGTCYSNNPFLAELLRSIGYDVDLLGADMTTPNVHTVIRVRLDGAEYHVDTGYGAPFYEPVPLANLPWEIRRGGLRYLLDDNGGLQMSVLSGSERVHVYRVHGPRRDRDFFTPVVLDSFQPGRTFMNTLRIVRFFDNHIVDLHDRRILRVHGDAIAETTLTNMAQLEEAMAGELAMSRFPVAEAVSVLERLTGRPFFDRAA
jgi:arylamine N-acetyltransferase